MRVNLASNYTFLNGSTAGWVAENGAVAEYTTDYAFFGEGSLQITKSLQNGSGVVMNAPMPVQAGKPYAVSVYARLPVTIPEAETAEITMTVVWSNSMGSVVGTTTAGTMTMTDDSKWYRLSGVWAAPEGATVISSIRIFQPIAGSENQSFIVDALLVEQAAYVGGFFFTYSEDEKYRLVQRALTPGPQVINGLRLGADISLNNLTFNTIDEFGTIWVVEDIRGWDGQTSPEMPDIGRGTDDGSYDVEGRLTSRGITVTGFFIPANGEAALTASKDRLIESINLVRKGGWLRLHTEPTRASWVRLAAAPGLETVNDRGRTQFSISLRAPDPIKYHWNDEDPEGFTYGSAQSSDVPDIFYANLNTNPSFEMDANAQEVRRNLMPNPNISNATGWTAVPGTGGAATGSTATLTNSVPGTTSSYRVTWTAATTAVSGGLTYGNFAVGGNTDYAFSAHVHVGSGTQRLQLGVDWKDGANATISSSTGPQIEVYTQPGRTGFTAKSPAGAVSAVLTLYAVAGTSGVNWAVGNTLSIAAVLIEATNRVLPYFDGNNPPRERVNICFNPRLGSGTSNWGSSGTWATAAARTTESVFPGQTYVYSAATVAATTVGQSIRWAGLGIYHIGQNYRVGFWARVSGTGSATAFARISTNTNLATGIPGGTITITKDGVWRWYSFNFTATATGYYIGVGFDAGVTNAAVAVTGLLIEPTDKTTLPTADEYFDGSTVLDGYEFDWSATADSSPSYVTINELSADWTGTVGNSPSIMEGSSPAAWSGTAGASYLSQAWAAQPDRSMVVDNIHSSGVSYAEFNLSNGYPGGVDAMKGRTFTALGTVRVRGALSLPTAANARKLGARFYGSSVDPDEYGDFPEDTEVATVRTVFTVPSDATSVVVRAHGISGTDQNLEGRTWWDDVAIIEGTYEGPYFDGNTENTPTTTYEWTDLYSGSVSTSSTWIGDVITNIGNASVTGIFTITGPAGPGTKIYNAATNETITLAQPLRGTSVVGDVIKMAALNGMATLTTDKYNGLRPGDRVTLLGLPIPFTTPGTIYNVLAASDVFPYSFSFEVDTDDIGEVDVNGQVTLVDNDVLVIDTYEKTVMYNGETTGHRYRLVTLTDWVKFGPGDNPIDFLDDALQVRVQDKAVASTIATLNTSDIHYLRPGDQILVQLPEEAELSRKALNGNVVTITTAEPHGFAVGDKVDVASTETSVINTKARTSNAVTLTTVDDHGISVSDFITVSMPVTSVPSQKQLSLNVATITTQSPHGYSVGDMVTIALPVTTNITNKRLIGNVVTLTTSGSHGYAVGDTVVVTMPSSASVVKKSRTGSLAYIETSTPHGFSVGDSAIIALPTSAAFSGNLTGDNNQLVTVTTTAAHNFSVGDKILLSGLAKAEWNGQKVIESVPTSTTFTFRDWAATAASSSSSAGATMLNLTNQSYNGTKTLVSASGVTFAYNY